MAARRTNLLTPARANENSEIGFHRNIGLNLKDGLLASGRKHNQPKLAFGELKNVLHNQKSQDSNLLKKNIFKEIGTPKCEQKVNSIKSNDNKYVNRNSESVLKDILASGKSIFPSKPNIRELQNILDKQNGQITNCTPISILDDFDEQDELNLDYENNYVTLPKNDYKSPEEYWAEQIVLTDSECDHILAPQFERKVPITFSEAREIMNYEINDLRSNSLIELDDLLDTITIEEEADKVEIPELGDLPLPSFNDWNLDLLL